MADDGDAAPAEVAARATDTTALPFDSHCHINPAPVLDGGPLAVLRQLPSAFACVCGTSPSVDWAAIKALAAAAAAAPPVSAADGAPAPPPVNPTLPRVVPGFGVHPWFAGPNLAEDWQAQLTAALAAHPHAIVGEIGLDKARTDSAPFDTQLAVFEAQLDVAAKLHRPISVHCVRAFGPMLDVFRARPAARLPPVIVMHGFTGSVDFAKSLLKIPKKVGGRFFFGIGARTTLTCNHAAALLAMLPPSRVLLESDAHDPTEMAACLAGAVPAAGMHPDLSVAVANANCTAALVRDSPLAS